MPVTSYVVVDLAGMAAVRDAVIALVREAGAPAPQQQDAALLTTELVTNAIIHAGAPATVRTTLTDHGVRVGVTDSSAGEAEVQPVDPHRVGGNGLRIVEAFAEEWGATPAPGGGKEVWFRLSW